MSEAETITRMVELIRQEFDQFHAKLTAKGDVIANNGAKDPNSEPYMKMTWPDLSDEEAARIRYAIPCGQTLAFTAIRMGLSPDQSLLSGKKGEDGWLLIDLRRAA